MAKIVRFWRGLARSMECAECGESEWTISRCDYETRGEATCERCGAKATYYRRGRTQPDAVRGSVVPESVHTDPEHLGNLAKDGGRR